MSLRSYASAALQRLSNRVAPPKLHAENLAGSSLTGGYEGTQRARRLFGFRPSEAAINSLLVFGGPTLRARARWLVRNNPYAKKAQRAFVTHVVGTGIRPVPLLTDKNLRTSAEQLWQDWSEEADADGLVDFYGLQTLAARAMFDAGECFMRFRPRYARDGLSVPFQVQLLESEFCPYEMNMVAGNGNVIRAGIEFNKIGQRVAYWFWRTHPGEMALPTLQVGYTRVPAEEVIHLFEPLRPGQIRGVSWLAAAIVRAFLLDQYDDAELERKKVAALFAAFITKTRADDDGPIAPQDQPVAGTADTSLNAEQEGIAGLTPGMLQILLEGEDVKFSEPADVGPNYEAFVYRALLGICASMDMPYSSVTGDYSKANYSSLRAEQLDVRASIRQVQNVVFKHQMCRATWQRFMTDAVLAGALPLKASEFNKNERDYLRAKYIPPRLEWVDPLKDVQAAEKEMRLGLSSRESIVAERGGTLEQVDAAIERSNESADSHGLVLDSDPRRTNTRGSNPPPDLTAPPAPPGDAGDLADQNETNASPIEEEEAA